PRPFRSLMRLLTYTHSHHSFPTRRSSDLCFACSSNQGSSSSGCSEERAFASRKSHNGQGHEAGSHWDDGYCGGKIPDCGGAAPGERKSTRLNSSHQIISYAVFCLKDKTII